MNANLQIKLIKSLQQKKNRQEHKLFLCEGDKIVYEIIKYKPEILYQIIATHHWVEKNQFSHPKLIIVSNQDIKKITQLKTSPEVMAVCHYIQEEIKSPKKLNIYLDQISDPGNLGTIIRTAEWYNVENVFLSPQTVDIYNSKVIQATMGSLFRVPFLYIDIKSLIEKFDFKQIIAADMKGSDLHSTKSVFPNLLIMGSESHGVSKEMDAYITDRVTINSDSHAESLNVAVATGIFLDNLLK